MNILEINDLIDQAVNPLGGDPKIKGPDLNSLLKTLSAEFDAGNGAPSWAALSAAIEAQRSRLDTLVTGAPQALDTLAEIAAQLAADEQGAAAILATQQQHTQQLANVVHRTGEEQIAGNKTFTAPLNVINEATGGSIVATSTAQSSSISIGSFLAPNCTSDMFFSVGTSVSNNAAALTGFSIRPTGNYAFLTTYGRPGTDLAVHQSGNVGIGNAAPTERLDVQGNVKATQFIGDGSQLTNLPTNAALYQRIADGITANYVRTYYLDAQSALKGAGAGGTANIYSMAYGAVNPNDLTTTVPGIVIPGVDMTINMAGLRLTTPDANTDVFSFPGGGKQTVNGNDTTIVTYPTRANNGAGWTIALNNSGATYDVTVNRVNLLLQGFYSWGLWFRGVGTLRFTGDITAKLNSSPVRQYDRQIVYNERGIISGKGKLLIQGNTREVKVEGQPYFTTALFRLFLNSVTTWEGDITISEDVFAEAVNVGPTLILRNGNFNMLARWLDSPLWRINNSQSFTIILESYNIIAPPTLVSLKCHNLILRGNTLLSGVIDAVTIQDERPIGLRGQGLPWGGGPSTMATLIDGSAAIQNGVLTAPAGTENASVIRITSAPSVAITKMVGFTNPRLLVYLTPNPNLSSGDAFLSSTDYQANSLVLNGKVPDAGFYTPFDFVELQREISPSDPTNSVWVELSRENYNR